MRVDDNAYGESFQQHRLRASWASRLPRMRWSVPLLISKRCWRA